MGPVVSITGVGEVVAPGKGDESLETLIFTAASQALADAGLTRDDLGGVVISASDQTDGRAISSMLTAGPAGAYLNEEINLASSPGHAIAMAWLQLLSGTLDRVLVASWGKSSESPHGVQPAERLSADPFFDRDGGLTSLAATALQATASRAADPRAADAAHAIAAKNHAAAGGRAPSVAEIAAADPVVSPLGLLELPSELDGAFALVLERTGGASGGGASGGGASGGGASGGGASGGGASGGGASGGAASGGGAAANGGRSDAAARGVSLAGVGWCSDTARIPDRDLLALPHLRRAASDAYDRAAITDPAREIGSWELHDISPDAELLAYPALGLCGDDEAIDLALSGETGPTGRMPVNRLGGSVVGEAPFGGPLRKLVRAVEAVREGTKETAVAQIGSGFAGQFQTVVVVRA